MKVSFFRAVKSVDSDDDDASDFVRSEARVRSKLSKPVKAGMENTPKI